MSADVGLFRGNARHHMILTTHENEGTATTPWTHSGLRIHPEVRRALRSRAALEGITIPELAHRIFVRELQSLGYVGHLSGAERRS